MTRPTTQPARPATQPAVTTRTVNGVVWYYSTDGRAWLSYGLADRANKGKI